MRRFFCIVLMGGILFSCHPSYADETYANKSLVAAGCLSAFIPGVGQIYNGDIWKGVACFGGSVIASNLMILSLTEWAHDSYGAFPNKLFFQGMILGSGVSVYSIADAVITANRINEEKKLGLEFKPQKDCIGLALSYKF